MNKEIPVKFNSGNKKIPIERPELIYGATAIVSNDNNDKTAINPYTNETIPVINLGENEIRFFIPAHNQEDFEIAKLKNLPIKQVIAPYFTGSQNDKIKKNVKLETRHSVIAVIKHPKKDCFLCVKTKQRMCQSFVMGGIENNETPEETAIREVQEETGYQNVNIQYTSAFKIVNHFYAENKGVNRLSFLNIVFGQLNDLSSKPISKEENEKHDVLWVAKDELKNFLNLNINQFALNILKNGDRAILTDGIMLTDDEYNLIPSEKVRNILLKSL